MKKLITTAAVCAVLIFSEAVYLDSLKAPEIVDACTVSAAKEKKGMEEYLDAITAGLIGYDEVDEITKVVIAEAEGESEQGQRYVIDVVLNRVDSKWFPDTVNDVLYQKNQFCVSGKRSEAWKNVSDSVYSDIFDMVVEEADPEKRLNKDIVFFRTQRYSNYGVPSFKCGAHYFSTYD